MLARTRYKEDVHLAKEKLDQFVSYVPKMVATRLSNAKNFHQHYQVSCFPCSVLFVDISGFTSLNEQYAKKTGGIEQVTKHINGYFSQLVAMIESHGGDVLKFAGDALIVTFGDENNKEDIKTNVLRATQCGMQIQTELREYDAEGIRLTLHIAVGAGDLFTFYLGGIDGRYEFFPAGDCFAQISNALDKSKSGQVFLSQQAWDLVKDVCEGTELEGDWHVTLVKTPLATKPISFVGPTGPSSLQLLSSIRRYIDKGIQKRLDAGQSEYLAEMRRVSVLFINLKGLRFQRHDDHHHQQQSQQSQQSPQYPRSPQSPQPQQQNTSPQDSNKSSEQVPTDTTTSNTTNITSTNSTSHEIPNSTNISSHETPNSTSHETSNSTNISSHEASNTTNITSPHETPNSNISSHETPHDIPHEIPHDIPHDIPHETPYSPTDTSSPPDDDEDEEEDIDDEDEDDDENGDNNNNNNTNNNTNNNAPPQDEKSVYDYAELNTVLRIMQKVVFRYEGFVRQFLLDDKGCTLIAVFGVPTAHSDDPLRAVSAALSIKNQLQAIGLMSYMGITTGQAFCGSVGSSVRQEYAVVGDIVNLSARLMVASYKGHHGILCDELTRNEAGTRCDMQPLDPITVKGKKDPINIFIPKISSTPSQVKRNMSVELRGRAEEKHVLVESLESLGLQLPSFAILCEGEAGSGKSILAAELIRLANEKYPGQVYTAGGDPIDHTTPFLPFVFLLRQILNFTEDRKANENIIKELFTRLSDCDIRNDCFSHAALLNELFGLEFPRNKIVNTLAHDTDAANVVIASIFREIFSILSKDSPRILIISDSQWLDVPSWSLILEIVRNTKSIILFITMRPIPIDKRCLEFSSLLENSNTCRIKLQPLSPDEILQVVKDQCALDVDGVIPQELSTLISEKALGNPFFAKEIIKDLQSKNMISKSGNTLEFKNSLSGVDIPGNLQTLVTSNFDRLLPTQQMILKVGSVLGKVIDLRVLEAVYPDKVKLKVNVEEEVKKLKELEILASNRLSSDNRVMFTSTLFAEVAYNMMLNKHRIQLHKSVAEYYEKKFQETDILSDCITQLTFHFEKAELPEKVNYYKERHLARVRWRTIYKIVSTIGFLQSQISDSTPSSPEIPGKLVRKSSATKKVKHSVSKNTKKKKLKSTADILPPKLPLTEILPPKPNSLADILPPKLAVPKIDIKPSNSEEKLTTEAFGLSSITTNTISVSTAAASLANPKKKFLSKLAGKLHSKSPAKNSSDTFTEQLKQAEELVLDSPRYRSGQTPKSTKDKS